MTTDLPATTTPARYGRTGKHSSSDLLKGALAGAAATWAMGQVTTWLYARESEVVRQRENDARGGHSAYENAAQKIASRMGTTLSDEQQGRMGTALHWTTGILAGVLYALTRDRWSPPAAARGLVFGAAFYLLVDELMNPVLGFTPGPAEFPWQAHARGLAGHLMFGTATELGLQALARVA